MVLFPCCLLPSSPFSVLVTAVEMEAAVVAAVVVEVAAVVVEPELPPEQTI